jgi:hypothetical protein
LILTRKSADLRQLNREATGLQAMYQAGARGALDALASKCNVIALILVKAKCRKYHVTFRREKLEEIAHDAAAQFIAMYLKRPGYSVRCFSARIEKDVLNLMFGRARNKQDAFEDSVLTTDHALKAERRARENIVPQTALDDLVAEHELGKKIAADLYRSRSYAVAVRRISAYVDQRWIYQHAEKMHFVFKTFRWRPARSDRSLPGPGSGSVPEGVLLERGQRECLQRDQ